MTPHCCIIVGFTTYCSLVFLKNYAQIVQQMSLQLTIKIVHFFQLFNTIVLAKASFSPLPDHRLMLPFQANVLSVSPTFPNHKHTPVCSRVAQLWRTNHVTGMDHVDVRHVFATEVLRLQLTVWLILRRSFSVCHHQEG